MNASLREAIARLEKRLNSPADVSALSVKLDAIAFELAQLPRFKKLKGADTESLDSLLSFIEADELAEIAEKLYEDSAEYDEEEALENANDRQEELRDGLERLFSPQRKPRATPKKKLVKGKRQ